MKKQSGKKSNTLHIFLQSVIKFGITLICDCPPQIIAMLLGFFCPLATKKKRPRGSSIPLNFGLCEYIDAWKLTEA